ncbi:MAG: flagellar motor switch protein FliN [Dehalococcoidia bacterium]
MSAALSTYDEINAEFAAVDHLGFELRVALSETEALLAALLVPLEGASALFGIDVSPEAMDDASFAAAQAGPITERMRSLLDLLNLTLFADGLAGTEITVSELRRGQVDWTMGMVQDVAQGSAPVRIEASLALASGVTVPVTLVVPLSLLTRMGEELAPDSAEPVLPVETPIASPPPQAAPAAEALFGGGAPGNVTQFPPMNAAQPPAGVGGGENTPVHPVRFPPLPQIDMGPSVPQPIDMLMDVAMRVSVELGRSSLTVEEVLELGPGSVVELNKLAGEPVDILVNDRLIARGEVVVVDENFGVRITEIISPRQRANALGR